VRTAEAIVDVTRGRFELDRAVLVTPVAAAITVHTPRLLAAPADLVTLDRVGEGQIDGIGRFPQQRGAAVPDLDRVRVLLDVVLRSVVEHAVRCDRDAVGIEPIHVHVVGEARVIESRAREA
jgi:hypothetical protein